MHAVVNRCAVRVFHVKHWAALFVGAVALCCDPVEDLIYPPSDVTPVPEGRFRVTFNTGPDVVRGFTPDGRIVYRTRGLPGLEDRWGIVSIDPAGGAATLEAAVYQLALEGSGQLQFDPGGRVLVLWKEPLPAVHGCPSPAPAPSPVVEIALLRLKRTDGLPLAQIPIRSLTLPTLSGAGTGNQIVRVTPADMELRSDGVDPFGPTVAQDGSGAAYVSDGETVFRVNLRDAALGLETVTSGAFPSVSRNGRLLAIAVPVALDSTVTVDTVSSGLFVCVQETRTIRAGSWEVRVVDLRNGSLRVLGAGLEPEFAPDGTRVLVRRETGLEWIGLEADQPARIAATDGAFAPALSPDGRTIAFSLMRDSADVFFVLADQNE